MRHRACLLALLAALAAPAWAIKEWYVHYDEAVRHLGRGRCKEALSSLRQAQQLKPRSGLQEQTYGLEFLDYLPYYHQGVCHLRLGDYKSAVAMFDLEEKQGAIRGRGPLHAEMAKLRSEAEGKAREEAQALERQRKARAALEEVQRLRREGDELYKAGKLQESLARLAQAQKAAELLDPATQQQILEKVQRIRQEANEKAEQAARAERIESALESGRRLLQERQPADAKIKFEEVLSLDPRHAAATEGLRSAEEDILAYTTQQERAAQLREGRSLLEGGQYEQALKPLAAAAADPENAEARQLLQKAQRTLEGMRRQKDLRLRIEGLLSEGERLLQARSFPEAMVKLATVLELDATHPRARERLSFAERMTGYEIFEKIFPNQEPVLTFIEPPPSELEGRTVAVVGLASDDRGLARIEYRREGQVVAGQSLDPDRDSGEFPRAFRIAHVFSLEPGANRISVSALDTSGVARVESFGVRRRLRFWETAAFLPSAAAAAVGLVGLGLAGQRARRQRAIRRRFNPPIAGAPVLDEDMYFGRQTLLTRILNVLHHNSLMITGERRIGKTTFLYRLKKELEADAGTEYRFFPVFSDLQGVAEEGFFHALMSDVADTLGLAPATLASLRWRPQGGPYDGRDFSHDLQRVIEELKTRTPKRVKLALLIDEVDVLNDYSERVNQRLRGIFMKTFSENLVAIMSGVGIKRTWTSEGSPWYNFFDEIELAPFTREEGEALIRQPVQGVFRFQPEAVERILEHSQLRPYLIQKYCIHAVNRMLEQSHTTVTAADVEAVRETVHFEGRGQEEPPTLRHQALA